MKNSMTNISRTVSIALAVLVFSFAPVITPTVAHAADYSSDYGYGDYSSPSYGYGDYYSSPSNDYGYGDYYSTTDYGYGDYYPTDYGYGDYYSTPSYSYPSSSYSSPGFYSNYGFAYGPSGGSGGGGSQTQTQTQQQQQQQTQTTTVTNTNNNVNNNNVNVNVPVAPVAQPVVYNNYNTYTPPTCQTGWYGTYPNCYKYNPVVYNTPTTPYVTLSQVPYTGLELGPVGTALYWGFLILWCFLIAYLLVVKRVQTSIYRSLNTFLFGSPVAKQSVRSAEMTAPTFSKSEPAVAETTSGVDPFIAAQISRARA